MSLADAALACYLESAAAEKAERVEVPAHKTVDSIRDALRAELYPEYQAIWDANNKRERHRTGRRKGKSHYLIRRKVAKTLVAREDVVNPYILPTLKSVTLVIWPLMKQIVRRHFGDDARINETLRTIKLPVGGTMVCGGCETEADAKNWFGMTFTEATKDECGNYPDKVLVQLSDEALEPSLLDFGGDMVDAGNPGLILRGRWYDETKDHGRTDDVPVYTGDCRSNPFLVMDPNAYFEGVKKKHGWTDTSPTFRRQYLGEWVEDSEGLVFPLTAGNFYEGGLPTRSLAGGTLPPHLWRYVIGVDIGYVDATAIVVLAAHPMDNREFMVSAEKYSNWLPRQLGQRLTELRKQYANAPIVMDAGGMGKTHAEECTRIYGLGIIPAEKSQKASAIRVLRDDIRSLRFQVPAGDSCKDFTEQCAIVGWDEDGEKPEEGLPDDVIHAAYYAHRWQHHYGERMAPAIDESPLAAAQREADRLKAAAMRRSQGSRGRSAWDRA